MSEKSVQLRVSYTGDVRKLYESVTDINGIVSEEYLKDIQNLEGKVVDDVSFPINIVFDPSRVSEKNALDMILDLDGVESVDYKK